MWRQEGGQPLNMEMALIYPRPKVDYNVSTLAGPGRVWENGDQVKKKGGGELFIRENCSPSLLLLPGGRGQPVFIVIILPL